MDNTQPKTGSAAGRTIFNSLEHLVQNTSRNLKDISATAQELIEESESPEEMRYFFNASQEDREQVMDNYLQNLNAVLDHDHETGRIDEEDRDYLARAGMSRLKNPDGRTIKQMFRDMPEKCPESTQNRYQRVSEAIVSRARKVMDGSGNNRKRALEFADYAYNLMSPEGGVTRIEARGSDNKIKLQNHDFKISIPLDARLEGRPKGLVYELVHALIAYGRQQTGLKGDDGSRESLSWNDIELHLGKNYSTKHHPAQLRRDSDRFIRENRIPSIRVSYA